MRLHARALLLVLPLLIAAPLTAQESDYVRVEYWECPSENLEPLAAALDSIWGPLFDELTEEGHFSSWLAQRPVRARDFEFVDEGSAEESSPPWQFVVVTTAPSREAMDAAWEDLTKRLQARYPDDPRPTLFCGDLMIVDHVTQRRG